MKNNTIIVFDFETGSLDTQTCEVIQVAAMAIDKKTLNPIPDAIFESLIKPRDFNNLQDEALAINKKTKEQLKQAPNIEVVWQKFIHFLSMFNTGRGAFTAPVPAGKNIRHFDIHIFNRICNELGYSEKNNKNIYFNQRYMYDLDEIMLLWFENSSDLPNMKMDTIRDYFGMSKAGAHDALVDVKQTAELITHFLKLHRNIYTKINFKDALKK